MSERVPATTIGELDIHLSHVQSAIKELTQAMKNMATQDDIARLNSRMENFATRAALDDLEKRLSAGSVVGTWDALAKRLGQLTTIVAGLTVAAAAFGFLWEITHGWKP